MKRIRVVGLLCLCVFCTACAPVMYSYHEPSAKNGYIQSRGCGGSGPYDQWVIDWPNNASLRLSGGGSNDNAPERKFYLKGVLSLPEGVVAKFESSSLKIADMKRDNIHKLDFNLVNYRYQVPDLRYKGNEALRGSTSVREGWFGDIENHESYFLEIAANTLEYMPIFLIELPMIEMNGKQYEIPEIIFRKVEKMKIEPLNC